MYARMALTNETGSDFGNANIDFFSGTKETSTAQRLRRRPGFENLCRNLFRQKKEVISDSGIARCDCFYNIGLLSFCVLCFDAKSTGANPTIESYNASAVKIYDATSSLVRFKDIIFSSTFEKTL
jgi:hypothetical protein